MKKRFWLTLTSILILVLSGCTEEVAKQEIKVENLKEDGKVEYKKSVQRPVDYDAPLSDIKNYKSDTIKNENSAKYDIDIKMDKKGVFSADVMVKVTNKSKDTWEDIMFQMLPNTFTEEFKPEWIEGTGKFDMKGVMVDGKSAAYKLDNSLLQVLPAKKVKPKDQVEVFFRYTFEVPEGGFRFMKQDEGYYLAQFYPMLSTYHGGWDQEAYVTTGESYHTDFSDFKVSYEVPKGYEVLSTSDRDKKATKGTLEAKKVKEFYMAVLTGMKVKTQNVNGTQVRVYAKKANRLDSPSLFAKIALESFEKHIGDYPYKQLDVITEGIGMEYPGIVNGNSDHTIAHEIAHQYFYGMVSSHPYRTPWIDESMTNFATHLFMIQDNYTKNSFERGNQTVAEALEQGLNMPSNLSLDQYSEGNSYGAFVYDRAPQELFRLSGQDTKKGFDYLKKYFKIYRYKEVDEQEWLRFTRSYFGIKDANDLNQKKDQVWYKIEN